MHNFLTNHLQNITLENPHNGKNLLPASFNFENVYDESKKCGGTRCISTLHTHFKNFWPDLRKI